MPTTFRYTPRRTPSRSPLTHPVLAIALLGALLSACGMPARDTEAPSDQTSSSSSSSTASSEAAVTSSTVSTAASAEPTPPTPRSSVQARVEHDSPYADGVYTANGTYRSPAGNESVTVTLTLYNGKVIAAVSDTESTSEKSRKFKGLFAAGLTQAVAGKPIDSLSLDIVNGSSLTPMGFMDALAKIKVQAAA